MIPRLILLALSVAISYASSCQRVVCYYTNWSQYRPAPQKFFPENVDATKCTHINYAFAKLVNDKLAPFEWNDDSEPWAKGMYERLHDHAKGQNPDVKILLSIGGWNMGSAPFTAMVKTPALRKAFAVDSIQFLRTRKFDGLDLDWEYPARRGSPPEDRQNFVELLKVLLDEYEKEGQATGNPRLLLTAAVAAGKGNIDPGYDVPAISKYLDFINVMTYDLHGGWERTTGHNSPLYARSAEQGANRYLNVDWAMKYWHQKGTPKNKLVVGLPTYGRTFTLSSTSNTDVGAPTSGPGRAGQYTREAGFLSYYEICKLIQGGADVHYIEDQKVPYLVSGDQWVGYDDPKSIKNKVKYMKDSGYGGVMIWAMDLDDFSNSCGEGQYPLISAIAEQCLDGGSSTSAPTGTTSTQPTTKPPTHPTNQPTTTPTTTTATTTTTTTKPPGGGNTGGTITCTGMTHAVLPSPYSCHDFFVCVHGAAVRKTCGSVLVFNPILKNCDWSYNYHCKIIPPVPSTTTTTSTTTSPTTSPTTSATTSATTSPTTSATTSPTTSATTSPTTSATTSPTTSATTSATTSPTTSPTTTPIDISNFCADKADGHYADPTNCKNYIQCANHITYIRPCAPGTVYNPVNGVCDRPENVPGCNL